jgi:hypothetical protein
MVCYKSGTFKTELSPGSWADGREGGLFMVGKITGMPTIIRPSSLAADISDPSGMIRGPADGSTSLNTYVSK